MKTTLFKALRIYLAVTAVMIINVILVASLWVLLSDNSSSRQVAGGMKPAKGDTAVLLANLGELDGLSREDGLHVDLRALVKLCGEPDGYVGDVDDALMLVYFYDRFGKKDWAAHVRLTNGYLDGVGWNASSANDHSQFKKWDIQEKDLPAFGQIEHSPALKRLYEDMDRASGHGESKEKP